MNQVFDIGGYKAVLNMGWLQDSLIEGRLPGKNYIADERDAFDMVPLIFRAVRLRADSLVRIPWYVLNERDDEVDWPYNDISLRDLLWRTDASLMTRGAAYALRLLKSAGVKDGQFIADRDLQWLNPFTMRVKAGRNGEKLFQQEIEGKYYPSENQYWTEEQMFYMREFSMKDDVGPGVSAASVAMSDGRSLWGASELFARFFESGGMPVTMILMPKGTSETEKTRVERFFKKAMSGVKKAFRIIGIEGETTKIEKLTPDLKDLDITNIDDHAIKGVSWAFDIPKTVLTSDSANYATAQTEYKNFLANTIVPRAIHLKTEINKFLEIEGIHIEPREQEMSEFQEDETSRSQALKNLVDSGMPLDVALGVLGYDIPEDVRASLNEAIAKKKEPPPQQVPPDQPMKSDLDKWLRKSLSSLKAGNGAGVEFKSEAIPETDKLAIAERLKGAASEEAVRKAFNREKE